jgi:glycosyltransferase involved in cell wall biosynthesis
VETIAVAGSLAQPPAYGGHAWVFLNWLLGFRRLGFDVLFLDRASPEADARRLDRLLGPFAIEHALVGDGPPPRELVDRVANSRFLLNMMGFLEHEALLAAAPQRVFVDLDPGFPQMWRELGLADVLAGHDTFVTVGGNVGRDECRIPTCGIAWVATKQPVVLDLWPPTRGAAGTFVSIGAWRGPFAPVRYERTTYGLRVHEFRKFAGLPLRAGGVFAAALDIDPADERDLALLRAEGWQLVDPVAATEDPGRYQSFVQRAGAEFGVAKGIYVETRSGWFSDRSACFLASGKPVLVQDTGFASALPTGEGLLAYSTLDEAVAGVEAIRSNYERHARAARAVAEEHFDSDKVLGRLLAEVGT